MITLHQGFEWGGVQQYKTVKHRKSARPTPKRALRRRGGGERSNCVPPPLRKRAGDGLSEVGWGSEILYLWSSPKSGNQIVFRVRVVQIRSNFGSCAVRIACPGDVARSTSLFVSRRYAEAGQIARTEGLLASSSVSGPGPL